MASSIWVKGPDSASVLSTPQPRADRPSGCSCSVARVCAACVATNRSWPIRSVPRLHGRIVNVSSLAGHVSFPYTETYAAAKDGLTAFSRVLRSDYRSAGVAATSLIVGAVKDAGFSARTLAETGLTANTSFAAKPEKVAAATLRAIDKGKAEIVVNPGPGRLLKALLDYFPGMGPVINRLSGADKLMVTVAEYREAARARKIAEEPGRIV
jgi:NAD(P)-dependent dehydrogenase (short-subunit alcohol dehydrogenase family)